MNSVFNVLLQLVYPFACFPFFHTSTYSIKTVCLSHLSNFTCLNEPRPVLADFFAALTFVFLRIAVSILRPSPPARLFPSLPSDGLLFEDMMFIHIHINITY